jgi:hypothetical protein
MNAAGLTAHRSTQTALKLDMVRGIYAEPGRDSISMLYLRDSLVTQFGWCVTKIDAAVSWLISYLKAHDGKAPSSQIKLDGGRHGHNEATLKRARTRANVDVVSEGYPKRTHWQLTNWKPEPEQPQQPEHTRQMSGASWGRHARSMMAKRRYF